MLLKLNENKRGLWQMYLFWCYRNGYTPSHYEVLQAWFEGREPRRLKLNGTNNCNI